MNVTAGYLTEEETLALIVSCSIGGALILVTTLVAVVLACCCCRQSSSYTTENIDKRLSTLAVNESLVFTSPQPAVVKPSYAENELKDQRRETLLGSRQHRRGDIIMEEKLGTSDYGPVYRAQAYSLNGKKGSRVVTVKMLLDDATEAQRIAFEKDIALLTSFNHVNVMGVLAVCTGESPQCIVLDAGLQGNLATHLRDARRLLAEGKPLRLLVDTTSTSTLFRMADEVCLGMAYLSSQGFVHRDLAARNCILGATGTVKIADFGIGPSSYPDEYHYMHGRFLPLRWMAVETIKTGQFSTSSDIWAFGVLMWELFSGAELPYDAMTNDEVIHHVTVDCAKLPAPKDCPPDAYALMSSCWESQPVSRPTFLALHEHLYEIANEQN